MNKAIVLGSHSFLTSGVKVGLQHIAEFLSQVGYEVHYVPVPSSPVDLLSKRTIGRFREAWSLFRNKKVKVSENLYEFKTRAPWTTSKLTFRYRWQLPYFSALLSRELRKTEYQLLIHDASTSAIFSDAIKAEKKIFRVNDSPRGFVDHVGDVIVEWFESKAKEAAYFDIWASSQPQLDELLTLNQELKICLIPNGYDMRNYQAFEKSERPKLAVYVGAVSEWLDVDLLDAVALILNDWQFHIYGPNMVGYKPKQSNVLLKGPIDNAQVTPAISQASVGLIPYKNQGHVGKIERPIKYYEYLAARLGVAVSDIPSFRSGMKDRVFYGSDASSFAKAIVDARENSKSLTDDFVFESLYDVSWDRNFEVIKARLGIE